MGIFWNLDKMERAKALNVFVICQTWRNPTVHEGKNFCQCADVEKSTNRGAGVKKERTFLLQFGKVFDLVFFYLLFLFVLHFHHVRSYGILCLNFLRMNILDCLCF